MRIINKDQNDTKLIQTYFDCILDILCDGIYISDSSGKTLKINSMYEKLTGIKEEEIKGRLVTDLVKEGVFNNILNPQIVKTGKPATSVQFNKKGRKVILYGFPIFDKAGKVVLVATFVRDITVLSQLEEQIKFQHEMINKSQQEVQYFYNNHLQTSSTIFESKDKEMLEVINFLKRVAFTDATILLLGETGVGKGVIARKIHEYSVRCKNPFFKIDCTTIPQNLIESELFGYERGSFSGANARGKPGLFEMAHNGTLFIDEVGELPLPMQGKLLRALQDQEIMRIGATKVKKIDVRIIAATNRDLEEEIKEGNFRADLYYRLKVAEVNIPSLRERKNDILPLAEYFLEKFNVKYKQKKEFSKDVEKIFLQHKWPGNIRELENLIQCLIITTEKNVIDVGDLPSNVLCQKINYPRTIIPSLNNTSHKSLKEIMDDIEQHLIENAMNEYGNISEVAKLFKVDRTTIFRKLKKHHDVAN